MEQKRSSLGVGNIVIGVYAVFALSATARAAYQIYKKFDEAPISYSLSFVAGLIYIIAIMALIRRNYTLAKLTISIELIGVVFVGGLSYLAPDLFPQASVWSHFGGGWGSELKDFGYYYIPLVLPIFGLWWLRRTSR